MWWPGSQLGLISILQVVVCLATLTSFARPAQRVVIKEISLGEIQPYPYPGFLTEHWTFTGDCRHLAYETKLNGQNVIFLDGRVAGSFAALRDWELEWDGSGIVAVAGYSNKWCVVRNGTTGPLFDSIGPPKHQSSRILFFSPDGSRLSYIATNLGKKLVITDGVRDKPYDEIVSWSVIFSADSHHLAYLARQRGTPTIVLDGKEIVSGAGLLTNGINNEQLAFWLSPNGKRLAYIRPQGTNMVMVVDGKDSRVWNSINLDEDSVQFSSDSAHFSYPATLGETNYILLDDLEFADTHGRLHFSPDGKRWAYVSDFDWVEEPKSTVVVDGIRQPTLKGHAEEIAFGPDSRSISYIIHRGGAENGKYSFVLNGKQSPEFKVMQARFCGSHHIALGYVFGEPKKTSTLFIDGKKVVTTEGEIEIDSVAINNDGRVAYGVRREKRIVKLSKAVSNTKRALNNAVKSGGKYLRPPEVTETIDETFVVVDGKTYGPYRELVCDQIVFSPDGRHFAFRTADTNVDGFVNFDGTDYRANGIWVYHSELIFDSPTHCHGLIHRTNKLSRIEFDLQ